MKPIIFIPLEYAADLEVDPSHLSHCNAGRKHPSFKLSVRLMKIIAAQGVQPDPRLAGITLSDFRPEVASLLDLPPELVGPGFATWGKPGKGRGRRGR